jgi:carbon monoxide dehydrogenase subunit G
MKLEGDYVFEAPVDEVWKALLDPGVLAAVMPGCEKLELVDGAYVGELMIKVGPIQGKFSGRVDLKDKVEPSSFTMVVDGKGVPGFVKATAAVKLEADRDDRQKTKIHYDADAQVGGKIASVGQRLIEASARAITKQSLDGLHENIKRRVAAAPKPEPEPAKPEPAAPKSEPPPPEPVVLKKADPNALAAEIAKEVTKSLVPKPVLIGLVVVAAVVVIWLVIR